MKISDGLWNALYLRYHQFYVFRYSCDLIIFYIRCSFENDGYSIFECKAVSKLTVGHMKLPNEFNDDFAASAKK